MWLQTRAPNLSASLHLKRMCIAILKVSAERSEMGQAVVH